MLQINAFNAPDAPDAVGGYAQAVEVQGAQRFVFVSGQIPVSRDESVPETFVSQARLVWANVAAQLRMAGMTLDNIVKVTTYLSDRRYAMENRVVRNEVLGVRTPALTVIVAEIFDPSWLLEIEVVAAA
jgi:enamine deaminase RidA (YjgF/YER057c/UK114 family)